MILIFKEYILFDTAFRASSSPFNKLSKWAIKMAPFTTTATMVDCLNFLLSQISEHYRLPYLAVATVIVEES
ncbi:hypothetical protein [Streptococcus sobrinus]|uniref:hypothetical protein n=2 Tax=Streptococcus sobrinus TaxID=1310 RepID=UPI0018A921B1|nr:hypothetical protein [Streptococcus sobrinus]